MQMFAAYTWHKAIIRIPRFQRQCSATVWPDILWQTIIAAAAFTFWARGASTAHRPAAHAHICPGICEASHWILREARGQATERVGSDAWQRGPQGACQLRADRALRTRMEEGSESLFSCTCGD